MIVFGIGVLLMVARNHVEAIGSRLLCEWVSDIQSFGRFEFSEFLFSLLFSANGFFSLERFSGSFFFRAPHN